MGNMQAGRVWRLGVVSVGAWLTVLSPAWAETVHCSQGGSVTQVRTASLLDVIPPALLLPVSGFPEVQVRVLETYNYSQSQSAKLERILPLMRTALNSEALRDFVLNHVYRGKKQFSDSEGLTNGMIFERLRNAIEERFENERYIAEFRTELYYTRRGTVGYTTSAWPSWIMTNTKFFSPWSESEVAGHLVHEWLHLIGFSHYETFDYSVPYAVGEEVARIAKAALAQER